MLLIAFFKDPLKCFRNSATYLVGNLAFSDMLYSLIMMTSIAYSSKDAIVQFLIFFSFYSSMLTIFSIALDRFLMITYPFKHRILMSGKRMGIWIAFIWLLSAIHPVKKIFMLNEGDAPVKSGMGMILIILTGVLYGKTYFALKKQNKSMVGMKNRFPFGEREYTYHKSTSVKHVTDDPECIDVENNNERARSQNDRAQIRIERAQIQKSRAQNQNERAPNQIERAPNQNERAPNQNERAQNQNERAQSQDERAQSQVERAQSQDDGAQSQVEHAQNRNDRAQSQGERRQSQNERAQSHNKNSQLVHNAKEQKFLTTIIIIALIAVLTALPGTIFFQVMSVSDSAGSTETKRIVTVVFIGIFCLNFAVNPLVYCLRLKRYRETFKIVYGCK